MSLCVPLRWGNVPVPYTALWTDEAAKRRPHVRIERWRGKRRAMLCDGVDAPSGKPMFTVLHGERTRRVVRELLCQMCVGPMPETVIGFNQGLAYNGRPVLRDGLPMCPHCAAEVFRVCPGLRRQEEAGILRIWEAKRGQWDHLLVINGEADPAAGGDQRVNDLVRRYPDGLFSGPDLLLSAFRRISTDELEAA